MKIIKPIVATLMFAIASSAGIGLIQAQPAQLAVRRIAVHPRALITQVELAEYRRAMNTAHTRADKQAIRESTYATLRQRAASRGMVMAEPHPWYGGLHWGEMGYQTQSHTAVVKTPEIKSAVVPVVPTAVASPTAPHAVATPVVVPQHAPVKPVSPPRAP